jgi:gamma-glutamylcyclotransferase (GGCT)/AIG2-like uncharacterized protein YtfP
MSVWTYVATEGTGAGFFEPTKEYVRVVADGLERWGLPGDALEAARRGVEVPQAVGALFVYGTLMRGEDRFALLEPFGLQCILLASARGSMLDLRAFPGLTRHREPSREVRGEFVRIAELGPALQALDRIEGFRGFGIAGSLFRRTLIEVDAGDGRTRKAWVYELADAQSSAPAISSGDWRQHRGLRERFVAQLVRAHSRGRQRELAERLSQMMAFAWTGGGAASLEPLAESVGRGVVSERRLAQASGQWAVVPG